MAVNTNSWALPDQIRRARTSLWLPSSRAAELLEVAPTLLAAWEEGDGQPDDEQLWHLAEAYGRPVAYFFSETSDPPRHQDYRSDAPLEFSEELAVRRAMVARFEELCRVQASLEDLVRERPGLDLVTSLRSSAPGGHSGEALADWVRDRFGLGDEPFKDVREWLEAIGIRVFVVDVPSPGFSGTSWRHPEFGAAMLLNRKDPASRRSFTAAHELGHLLRTRDLDPAEQPICGFLREGRNEEQFANQFAASLLMPSNAIRAHAATLLEQEELTGWHTRDAALEKAAKRFGVSREAASWRMEALGILPSGFTAVRRIQWAARPQFYRGRRGPRWTHRLSDLGPKHVGLARSAYSEGKLSLSALATALQLDPDEAFAFVATAESALS